MGPCRPRARLSRKPPAPGRFWLCRSSFPLTTSEFCANALNEALSLLSDCGGARNTSAPTYTQGKSDLRQRLALENGSRSTPTSEHIVPLADSQLPWSIDGELNKHPRSTGAKNSLIYARSCPTNGVSFGKLVFKAINEVTQHQTDIWV